MRSSASSIRIRSNSLQAVDGRFVGADALVAKAKETGQFDYDATLAGLQAVDRYTLRFQLVFADYELLSNLTTTAFSAVAREAIEAYRDGNGWAMANPSAPAPIGSRIGGAASASCSKPIPVFATSAIRCPSTPPTASSQRA